MIVGDDDADPRVARIIATDAEGNVELVILHAALTDYAGRTNTTAG